MLRNPTISKFSLPLSVAVFLGLLLAPACAPAQEDPSDAVVVGTYDPQQLAQSAGLQQEMMRQMQELQQRMQTAQQEQDQQAMQQIQAEAQQIQQDLTNDFLADIEAVMADVAEESGTDIIATEVSYTAPGVETKDVTDLVADAMGLETPAAAEAGSEAPATDDSASESEGPSD